MDDLLNYSTNITVTFCKIEITQTGRFFVVMGVRLELESFFFSVTFRSGIRRMRHTMACERLCVRMTLPIVRSTSKEISTDTQMALE